MLTGKKPAIIVFLGPPGAGKGTQARIIAEKFNLLHLSTGDLLREAVNSGSSLGVQIRNVMDSGQLVSDTIVLSVLSQRMSLPDITYGVILDGFPRTAPQAIALDQLLLKTNQSVTMTVNLEAAHDAILQRICGRYSCTACGEGYHDLFKQPQTEGVCDNCGSTTFQRRADDNVQTVRDRLDTYYQQTQPLVDYYLKKKILFRVNAMRSIPEIQAEISEFIGRLVTYS